MSRFRSGWSLSCSVASLCLNSHLGETTDGNAPALRSSELVLPIRQRGAYRVQFWFFHAWDKSRHYGLIGLLAQDKAVDEIVPFLRGKFDFIGNFFRSVR